MKTLLLGNPHPGRRPHICYVYVLLAVVVVVKPACAHACAGIVGVRFRGNSSECSVAVAAIEIAATEIVGNVQIGPAIAVHVAPGASEAVSIILDVQPCSFGAINERAASFVVHEEIRRPISGIVVRSWVVILIEAEIVVV